MACNRCGAPTTKRLCSQCDLAQLDGEDIHSFPELEDDQEDDVDEAEACQ